MIQIFSFLSHIVAIRSHVLGEGFSNSRDLTFKRSEGYNRRMGVYPRFVKERIVAALADTRVVVPFGDHLSAVPISGLWG